ncbi:MAG: MAE_28990/MAE_18760 family HEPN-like nuclease [Candidatus Methanoperedens sp.]
MKIQSEEKLFELLDEDLAWRKKELTSIMNSIQNAYDKNEDVAVRIGVTMLYAHWQGYVINASNWYINYLRQLNLKYKDLTDNFITLSIKRKIKDCSASNKTATHSQVVHVLMNGLGEVADLPHKNAIDKASNLNFEIFSDILFTLGLNLNFYSPKKNLIDTMLLDSRNKIAHGERYCIDREELTILYKEVLDMLECFQTQIIDAVQKKLFLR